MRITAAFAAALFLTANITPALAKGHGYSHSSNRSYSGRYYTNVSGHRVHSPVFNNGRPAGATAHCADGSWSFSEHARGTCSHHGGVR